MFLLPVVSRRRPGGLNRIWQNPHLLLTSGREEEESLKSKIRADHELALEEAREKLRRSQEELRAEIPTEKNRLAQDLHRKEATALPLPPVPMPKLMGINDGDPGDPQVKEKRDKIREVRGTEGLGVCS
ncbi:mannosyl-oligosaccharide 1,2-alpha-mannosidase IB [Arapaima gigas]